MKGEQNMIKMMMEINGTGETWTISDMDSLAKFQAHLTEEFFKHYSQELPDNVKSKIIDEFLEDAEGDHAIRCDLVEKITNNMYRTCEDIAARLLADTDYDTIDEITEELDRRGSALYDIYEVAREYV